VYISKKGYGILLFSLVKTLKTTKKKIINPYIEIGIVPYVFNLEILFFFYLKI